MPAESIVVTLAVLVVFVFFMTVLAYVDMQSWRQPPSPRRHELEEDPASVALRSEQRKT